MTKNPHEKIAEVALLSQRAFGELTEWLKLASTDFFGNGERKKEWEAQVLPLTEKLQALHEGQTKVLAALESLNAREKTHEFNLEQLSKQQTILASKTEELTRDFIEREIVGPMQKEFARIAVEVDQARDAKASEMEAVLERISGDILRYLDDQEVSIIYPKKGDAFDPQQHRPVHQKDTSDKSQHGKISRTFQPGLSGRGRVIESAKVEIFTHKPKQQKETHE